MGGGGVGCWGAWRDLGSLLFRDFVIKRTGSDLQTMDSWFISTAGPCGRCSFSSPRHMQIPTVPPLSLRNCRLFRQQKEAHLCARPRPRLCGAHMRLCVQAGPCSRQGPALFQEINKRCRVPPPTEPRQKVGADRRHTQGFSGRIWDVYGAASVRHPGCFFFKTFFSLSLFFP